MKKVFVAGATGGMGYALVNELTSRGIEVIAFARTLEHLKERFSSNPLVNYIAGDVLKREELLQSVQGADFIIHAVSFPYEQWEEKHIPCLQNLLDAAKSVNGTFVMIDNIYAYGKATSPVNEDAPKLPHTKKGKLRLLMAKKIESSNVPYLILHLPDLFGPYAINTALYSTLQAVVQNKNAYFLGRMDVTREFAYTLDAAKAAVELSLDKTCHSQHWNIPGSLKMTGDELQDFLCTHYSYRKHLKSATYRMVAFLAVFSRFMREQKEMMYLAYTPVILSSEKLEKVLGTVPLSDGWDSLRETMGWIKEQAGAKQISSP